MVGAGPWGLATAWLLLEAGASVVVFDDGRRPAGHVAAGMLGARSEAEEDERDLQDPLRRAGAAWPAFASRLRDASGRDPGWRRSGALALAARPVHVAAIRRRHRVLEEWDDAAAWLDADRLREIEPGLGPAVLGGMHFPEEHQVEPRAMLAALADAVAARGGHVVRVGARALLRRDGAVCGVRDQAGGDHRAGHVVMAAGYRGPAVADGAAIRPVKGQILRLRAVPGAPVPITHTVRTPDVYLAPRDDEVVVGATTEERGDEHATAGAVADLLDDALRTVPELAEMDLAEVATGLRPAAPDGRPVIGTTEPGLTWASGGHRNGIALTPIAAAAAADLALGGDAPGWSRPHPPPRTPRR